MKAVTIIDGLTVDVDTPKTDDLALIRPKPSQTADEWGFCYSHMDVIPKGQPIFENDGLLTCESCDKLYKKRTARAESGAVTSKNPTLRDRKASHPMTETGAPPDDHGAVEG